MRKLTAVTVGSLLVAGGVFTAASVPASAGPIVATNSTFTTALNSSAAETTATTNITWGVKQSFRSYVGFVGTTSTQDPASRLDSGLLSWGEPTFENNEGSRSTSGKGTVVFDVSAHTFILTLANPTINVSSDDTGEVIFDAQLENVPGETINIPDFVAATFDLSDIEGTEDGDTIHYSDVPTVLSNNWGALHPNLGGPYNGVEGDPISFSLAVEEEAPVWEPAIELFAADGETPLGDTEVSEGDVIVVNGSGFDPQANNPGGDGGGAPIPNNQPQGFYISFGNVAETWKPSEGADGSARAQVRGNTKWALLDSVVDGLSPQMKPIIQASSVTLNEDGTFSAEITASEPENLPENGTWGVFTYPAGGTTNAEQEIFAPVNFVPEEDEAPVWEPAIELFAADGETPLGDTEVTEGDVIVVKGSGFDPQANNPGGDGSGAPIPNNQPQGTFISFGNVAETWKPSEGADSTARAQDRAVTRWVLLESVVEALPEPLKTSMKTQTVFINEDGTFTAEITAAEPENLPENGTWGIFTYAGGATGFSNAAQEILVPVNFVPEEDEAPVWEPAIELFAADGETPLGDTEVTEGDVIVVKGTGFDPQANNPGGDGSGLPIPNNKPQGTFVAFGNVAETWKPSEGADGASRSQVRDNTQWVLLESVVEELPAPLQATIKASAVFINEDGTFTAEVTAAEPENIPENGTWGIYTYAGGAAGNANPAQEILVPVNFAPGATDEPTEEPSVEIEQGQLVWGFKSSWRNYVLTFAQGAIHPGANAEIDENGIFHFEGTDESEYDAETGDGVLKFDGRIRFQSSMHDFDIVIEEPWVTITEGGTKGILSAATSTSAVPGDLEVSRVDVAELEMVSPESALHDETGLTTFKWTELSGTFLETIQPQEFETYVGQAIDPITFEVTVQVDEDVIPEPTEEPTTSPEPSEEPTEEPTTSPEPSEEPTEEPTTSPEPSEEPTEEPTTSPEPSEEPSEAPTDEPSEDADPTDPATTDDPDADDDPAATGGKGGSDQGDSGAKTDAGSTDKAAGKLPATGPTTVAVFGLAGLLLLLLGAFVYSRRIKIKQDA